MNDYQNNDGQYNGAAEQQTRMQNQIKKDLSADPWGMIIGILSLVLLFTGCCCGILLIFPLILSIIGLLFCNSSLRTFALDVDSYKVKSYNNVKQAKTLNIIALVISAVFLLILSLVLGKGIMDGFDNSNWNYSSTTENDWYYEDEEQTDPTVIINDQGEMVEEIEQEAATDSLDVQENTSTVKPNIEETNQNKKTTNE
jgi:hypothetical protein